MARNSEDVASAILAVNEIVAAQTEALSNVKSVLASKTADMTLGLTGASIGDMIKIKSVDTDGKPTEWEILGSSDVEFTANRVTTIDENSDDEHYPSAGAVYDAIESAGGSFIVTLTKTDGVYSADRTFAQIGEAVGKGLTVLVSYGNFYYRLAIKNNGVAYFTFASNFSEGAAVCMISCSSEDVWNDTVVFVEKTDNRVTKIGSESTDTQYPSAKAVYTLAENTKTFIVKVTAGSTITADKTFAQIRTAINSGRIVAAKYNNDILMPAAFYDSSTTEVSFAAVMPTTYGYTIVKMLKCTSENVWSYATYNLEHQNDMVTTIDASSANNKYPSAKAVYDSLPTLKTWTAEDIATEGETT